MTATPPDKARLITLAADIVSAYVSNNHIQTGELSKLLSDVHGAICVVSSGPDAAPPPAKATPQEIRRSISPDHLISFEDGKPYRTLRRHLTLRGLTPEQYRAKWGLAPDYPMTSQTYSEQRSELARALGLGQQRRKFTKGAPETKASETKASETKASETKAAERKAPEPVALAEAPPPEKKRRTRTKVDA